MNCPRCHSRINVDPDELADGPDGLVAVVAWRFDPHERRCRCGWSFTVESSIGRPRHAVKEHA